MPYLKTILMSILLLLPVIITPVQAGNASKVFDIDGNGETSALSDGLLILRYFFGFSDASLISGAIGSGATRNTSAQIIDYIENPPNVSFVGVLNDTGITDNTTGSDGTFGRDVTHNDDADGHAGFSFTKINNVGADLDVASLSWSCVKDNVTSLIWEVKTNDGGLRDVNNTYTWYNPYVNSNGGDAGIESGANDTDSFVTAVNAASLCGASDWRMPTVDELRSIVDYSAVDPSIDTAFFPNTSLKWYWSSSPYANTSVYAWVLHFGNGNGTSYAKHDDGHVRLVRSGQ